MTILKYYVENEVNVYKHDNVWYSGSLVSVLYS